MLWRSISAAIVLFWAVMTGLIIRDAYFPDSSHFAEIPPKIVFEMFLSQSASFSNQLQLYHDREKIGHAHFSISRVTEGEEKAAKEEERRKGPIVYAISVNGSVSAPGNEAPGLATGFHLRAELENGDQWRAVDLQTRTSAIQTVGLLKWKRGDKFPQIEVKRGDEVVLNSEIVQTMMAVSSGMGGGMGMPALGGAAVGKGQFDWLSQIQKPGAAGSEGLAVQLAAREGTMDLAGKSRRCYLLMATFAGMYEVKFFFTEVGELARIDMPGGYRFVEPLMHGLEPDLNTLE